jgi:hypothetical protein
MRWWYPIGKVSFALILQVFVFELRARKILTISFAFEPSISGLTVVELNAGIDSLLNVGSVFSNLPLPFAGKIFIGKSVNYHADNGLASNLSISTMMEMQRFCSKSFLLVFQILQKKRSLIL